MKQVARSRRKELPVPTPLERDARRATELAQINAFIAEGKMRIIGPKEQNDNEPSVFSIYGTDDGVAVGPGCSIRAVRDSGEDVTPGREAEVLDSVWPEG